MLDKPWGYVANKEHREAYAITFWDPRLIIGMPTDLVDKAALDDAIAGIPKPDLSAYLT